MISRSSLSDSESEGVFLSLPSLLEFEGGFLGVLLAGGPAMAPMEVLLGLTPDMLLDRY